MPMTHYNNLIVDTVNEILNKKEKSGYNQPKLLDPRSTWFPLADAPSGRTIVVSRMMDCGIVDMAVAFMDYNRDLWPFGEFKKKFKDGRFTHYCTVPDKFSVIIREEKEDE